VVHVRTVDLHELTFQVSGKLWRNSLVMQDNQTETLWCHITGEALDGPLVGTQLQQVPAVQTTWAAWREAHPDGKLLRKSEEIRSSRYTSYFADPKRTGLFRTEWLRDRLPGKTKIIGIVDAPHALAVTEERLGVGQLLMAEIGDRSIVLMRASDGGVRAFAATVDGDSLTFEPNDQAVQGRDQQTGSRWDLTNGVALDGHYAGKSLAELVIYTAYWFAWSSFYPNTTVLD